MLTNPDFVLVGTGVAPLLAAARMIHAGKRVVLVNPDRDFFLENSELPLDVFFFENTNSDLSKRFENNITEQVYRDLSPDFPGALEVWNQETNAQLSKRFVDLKAPWIRSRQRLWVAAQGSDAIDRFENLYLRALDAGWKPQWLEGLALAKRFPGFSAKSADGWVGFMGPKFADVDVHRYRLGLAHYIRERLASDQIYLNAHLLDFDSEGLKIQPNDGLPVTLRAQTKVLFFWTPRMERWIKLVADRMNPDWKESWRASIKMQNWEEWVLLSREPISNWTVAQWERVRVWATGEGAPPETGWNSLTVLRRASDTKNQTDGPIPDLEKLAFGFLGWEKMTVRSMKPRRFYRWNKLEDLYARSGDQNLQIVSGCDGPIHWIARQVRSSLEGVV